VKENNAIHPGYLAFYLKDESSKLRSQFILKLKHKGLKRKKAISIATD
jgi:hypothetical protein